MANQVNSSSSIGSFQAPSQADPFTDITSKVSNNRVQLGAPSWFKGAWTESFNMFNEAVKTHSIAQGLFALGRMALQTLGTITFVMPLISLWKDTQKTSLEEKNATAAIGMTYSNKIRGEENKKALSEGKGILDRAHAENNNKLRYGFVADCSGHADPNRYDKMDGVKSLIQKKLQSCLEGKSFKTVAEMHQALRASIKDLNDPVMEKGVSTTLHIAVIANVGNEKVAVTASIGDSSLYLLKKDGNMSEIGTHKDHSSIGSLDPNHVLKLHTYKVEDGDRIIGVTDGVTDSLPINTLKSIFNLEKKADGIIRKATAELKNNIGNKLEGTEKAYNPESPHASDDISAFVLEV